MLRVEILEGASINITTYLKEQQTKFLGGANQFLGGTKAPPLPPPEINPALLKIRNLLMLHVLLTIKAEVVERNQSDKHDIH